MVHKEYTPRKSLRDEHITKIIGEGVGPDSIRITIQHEQRDKKPIAIEIRKDWYGDVRERFRTDAEAYFTPATILELDREIGGCVLDMVKTILADIEKHHREEIALRQKQVRAEQIAAQGPSEERLETESSLTSVGDWRTPISVKQANHARANTVITVYGQIVSKNKLHAMVKGGQYQCSRCHLIQYIEYERRSYPGDDEAPVIMNRMCRDCGEEDLQEGSHDHQLATRLHRVGIEDVRAVDVELMDASTHNDIDTIQVKLFDEHAKDVKVGEYVVIRGKFYLRASSRNRRLYHGSIDAHDIKYVNQTAHELKPEDFTCVRKFIELVKMERPVIRTGIIDKKTGEEKTKFGKPLGEDNIIKRLVSCYSRHRIIWNEPIKEALLYAECSAGPDVIGRGSDNEQRKRIHVGIVGDKGVGKSTKARSVVYHDERNRYESAQGSSGKSMSAIVSKESDHSSAVLRVGPLAFAQEAVIVLNEFGEVSLAEQVHFQDSMEEGEFTIDKYGIRAKIRADSVVVWTSNPIQGASFSKGAVSLEQIPIRKQIIDRTDLLMIDRPVPPNKRREFNHLRAELKKARDQAGQGNKAKWNILCRYDDYVKIHLMVAKRLAQKNGYPQLTDEASDILEEADSRIQEQRESDSISNAGSNRSFDALVRLATVIAMLKLKDKIEPADAKHAVAFYNDVVKDVQSTISVPEDPAVLAMNTMIFILQDESNGLAMTFLQLAELASARDPAIKWYLYRGPKNKLGNVSSNARLQRVLHMLENYDANNIKRVKVEPAEFLWVGNINTEEDSEETLHADVTDVTDVKEMQETPQKQPTSPDIQTEMSSHTDMPKPKRDPKPKSTTSQTSQTSPKRHNIPLEEKEDKVLMACGMAMADYNSDKVHREESGALFETYGVWYHLHKMFPEENWTVDQVRRLLMRLVEKGRVLTKHGDASDGRYYLIHADDDDGGGVNQ